MVSASGDIFVAPLPRRVWDPVGFYPDPALKKKKESGSELREEKTDRIRPAKKTGSRFDLRKKTGSRFDLREKTGSGPDSRKKNRIRLIF